MANQGVCVRLKIEEAARWKMNSAPLISGTIFQGDAKTLHGHMIVLQGGDKTDQQQDSSIDCPPCVWCAEKLIRVLRSPFNRVILCC